MYNEPRGLVNITVMCLMALFARRVWLSPSEELVAHLNAIVGSKVNFREIIYSSGGVDEMNILNDANIDINISEIHSSLNMIYVNGSELMEYIFSPSDIISESKDESRIVVKENIGKRKLRVTEIARI
jgi:hypothetical protein